MRFFWLLLCLVLLPVAALGGPSTATTATTESYGCPMRCEGAKLYHAPQNCPVCGMALGLIGGERYRVAVAPAGDTIEPGVETALAITIDDPHGKRAQHLDVVHEKLVHLLITSEDLSWFAHEHPERQKDGTFELRMTFPAPGRYTLFHDFTPKRVGMQVVPVDVVVA